MWAWSMRGLDARLAPEAVAEASSSAKLARQQLERHRAAERELRRLVDDTHAAAAEHPFDAVAADLRPCREHCRPILAASDPLATRRRTAGRTLVRPARRRRSGAQTPSIERAQLAHPSKPVFQP